MDRQTDRWAGKQTGKTGKPPDRMKDRQTDKKVGAPGRQAGSGLKKALCEWETDGGQTHVSNTGFPMIDLSLFVSSLQQSVFLAVMKNTASVTNLESASKLPKQWKFDLKPFLMIVSRVCVVNSV